MNVVWAIARRDLLAAFGSPLMWLVLAAWMALVNLVFWMNLYSLQGTAGSDSPLFTMSLSSGVFFLALLAPALTMNSFALERSQATMQLLLTVPISEYQLVLGKFAAAMVALASLVAATLVQPAVLVLISSVPLPQLLAGYLGLLLCCAFYAALGVWISLLVDSPVSAYVITFGVIAVLFLIGFFPEDGALAPLSQALGMLPRAGPFFRGELHLGGIAFFMGGTAAFLLMSHSSLRARRIHG